MDLHPYNTEHHDTTRHNTLCLVATFTGAMEKKQQLSIKKAQ
jgi:hypothetical protein